MNLKPEFYKTTCCKKTINDIYVLVANYSIFAKNCYRQRLYMFKNIEFRDIYIIGAYNIVYIINYMAKKGQISKNILYFFLNL